MTPDWEWIPRDGSVPPEAAFGVRMQDDTMAPLLPAGTLAYAQVRPVYNGEVGIFLLDGQALCRQFYRDAMGMVYLFALNRRRGAEDRIVPPSGLGRLVCLGRVTVPPQPLPGREEEPDGAE